MTRNEDLLTGVILDETIELTVDELCRSCSTRRDTILSMVEEGILQPVNRTGVSWRFTGVSVKRAIKATKLHRDLELNLPGVALALDLMDEIDRLRARLAHISHQAGIDDS